MAETLGSLCDKLTIVKLKQWHVDDESKLRSLTQQELQLKEEIDSFVSEAMAGNIPLSRVRFPANKVYRQVGNETGIQVGGVGALICQLSEVNCRLWHVQEKVYEIESVSANDKDTVIKELAVLNLQRNMCVDAIDNELYKVLERNHKTSRA